MIFGACHRLGTVRRARLVRENRQRGVSAAHSQLLCQGMQLVQGLRDNIRAQVWRCRVQSCRAPLESSRRDSQKEYRHVCTRALDMRMRSAMPMRVHECGSFTAIDDSVSLPLAVKVLRKNRWQYFYFPLSLSENHFSIYFEVFSSIPAGTENQFRSRPCGSVYVGPWPECAFPAHGYRHLSGHMWQGIRNWPCVAMLA